MSTATTATTKSFLSPRPQFKNILFATDFSPCSKRALPIAKALAQRHDATLFVAHVYPADVGEMQLEPVALEAAYCRPAAELRMAEFIEAHDLGSLPHRVLLEAGPIWEALSRMVEENHIDLIVLGTHGRSGLKHLVLGSVAEQIFRHADCPVLTVGPKARDGFRLGRLETIVYATDLSAGSRGSLPYALSLARANRSYVILVHALLPLLGDDTVMVQPDELLENAKLELKDLVPDDIPHEVIVKVGPISDLILNVAAESKAALIVMGAHRASSHTPWAVAHKVVCHATCPVLTVRG